MLRGVVRQTGLPDDQVHVREAVLSEQVDAVPAAGLIFVDLVDGIFDPGLSEVRLFPLHVGVKGVFHEGVGEDPVFAQKRTQGAGHDTAAAGENRVDGLSLVGDGQNAGLHGQMDARCADGVQPVAERVHIPAGPGQDACRAAVLLAFQGIDLCFQGLAVRMTLRGTGHRNGELAAKLPLDQSHQFRGGSQTAAGSGKARGRVAPQCQNVADAMIQIGLQLGLRALRRVAQTGKMGNGGADSIRPDPVQNVQILSRIDAAWAVGAGDIAGAQGVQPAQDTVLAAQRLHACLGSGRKHFKMRSKYYR